MTGTCSRCNCTHSEATRTLRPLSTEDQARLRTLIDRLHNDLDTLSAMCGIAPERAEEDARGIVEFLETALND